MAGAAEGAGGRADDTPMFASANSRKARSRMRVREQLVRARACVSGAGSTFRPTTPGLWVGRTWAAREAAGAPRTA